MEYVKTNVDGYLQLMDQYRIGSLLAKLFVYYQWDDVKICEFLSSMQGYQSNHHPIAMQIKERLLLAKQRNEKVFVFGDYDTDGICATAMMVQLLKEIGIDVGFYIPNRLQEGYGLNVQRTMQAIEKGYQLLITVDNGVKAHEALLVALDNNVDVIVMDHHTIEESVPCTILWHPTLIDDSCKYLCGAGCVLQIVKLFDVNLDSYLALATVATIGDMMVLDKENRWIVQQGLKVLNLKKHLPLNALMNQYPIDEETIAFSVVPKLNAVGRLADRANVNQVVQYLLCKDVLQIEKMAIQIQALNDERKKMTLEHEELVQNMDMNANFIIVKHEMFHPGIVGLLANRLCKSLHKPIMVLSEKDDCYVGSVRSIDGLDLMECLSPISQYFEAFGGHKQAAGLTFKKTNYEYISKYLQEYSYSKVEQSVSCLVVDDVDLQWSNIQEVFSYGPFGQGVELPLVWYNPSVIKNYRFMKKETYLKWQLSTIEAIWFSNTCTYKDFIDENDLVFVGKLGKNTYRGMTNYVLQLEDVIK